VEREATRARLGLASETTIVALFPGSRTHEVAPLAPLLLDAARSLRARHPSVRFLLPVAEPLYAGSIRREVERRGLADAVLLTESSHDALRASDLVLLASGTASLEAALLGVPMVVVYRVARFTIGFVRFCIRVGWMDSETMALPNLVLGRTVVPELRQEAATVERVVAEAARLLDDAALRAAMRADLALVRERLGPGQALERVTERVLLCAEESASRVREMPVPSAGEPELAPVKEARR
jgi:lipid-A-disaccharide synthase